MDEILNQLKQFSRNYKKLEDRNQTLENVLQELLDITRTDNYGNLIKRVTKLASKSNAVQDEYWWFNEPDHWYQGYKVDKKARRQEALRLTQKCLEKFRYTESSERQNKLLNVFRSCFKQEVEYKRYKFLCNFIINDNPHDSLLDKWIINPYDDGGAEQPREEKRTTSISTLLPKEMNPEDVRKVKAYKDRKKIDCVEDCSEENLAFFKSIQPI